MLTQVQRTIGQYTADFLLEGSQITIEIRSKKAEFILRSTITNDKLPPSFVNIFDDVADLFDFLKNITAENAEVIGNVLKLMVKVIKMKEVRIELEKVAISKTELMEQRVEKLEKEIERLEAMMDKVVPSLKEKFFEDSKKIIKPLTDQVKKLNEKIATLQEKVKNQSAQLKNNQPVKAQPASQSVPFSIFKNLGKIAESNNIKATPLSSSTNPKSTSEKLVTMKIQKQEKLSQSSLTANSQVKISKLLASIEKEQKIYDFQFDIDRSNEFLSFFLIDKNTITRVHEDEEIYTISSSNSIPKIDCHSVKIRVNKITQGLIWIGLIVESKKAEQYIGEEREIIQFSLEGNKVLIDGKSTDLKCSEFKNGDIIEMRVDISLNTVKFYKNGRPNALYELTIPESMAGKPLFPYIQMINEGDSLTIF